MDMNEKYREDTESNIEEQMLLAESKYGKKYEESMKQSDRVIAYEEIEKYLREEADEQFINKSNRKDKDKDKDKSSIYLLLEEDDNFPQIKEELDFRSMSTQDLTDLVYNDYTVLGDRKSAFNEIRNRDIEYSNNILTSLCRVLEHTNSKNIQSFIVYVIDYSNLDINTLIECCRYLHRLNYDNWPYYFLTAMKKCIEEREGNNESKISIIFYTDMLCELILNEFRVNINSDKRGNSPPSLPLNNKDNKIIYHIKWFIDNSDCNVKFIHSTLSNIVGKYRVLNEEKKSSFAVMENGNDDEDEKGETYISYAYNLLYNKLEKGDLIKQYPEISILCCQYILQMKMNNEGDNEEKGEEKGEEIFIDNVQKCLLDIAKTSSYNNRADAADIIMKLGNQKYKDEARNIIIELGKIYNDGNGIRNDNLSGGTLYGNSQNVHDETIEDSVMKFILTLGSESSGDVNFEKIQQDILNKINRDDDKAKAKVLSSLTRIKIDHILYPGSQKLLTIFLKIWNRINSHPNRESLLERLVEELIDMDNTCSSGRVSRLVNVFSGIEESAGIKISFKSQIEANVMAYIKREIDNIKDVDLKGEIISELDNTDPMDRRNLSSLLLRILPPMERGLFDEFVSGGYVTEDQFYLYFRDAISYFETGARPW